MHKPPSLIFLLSLLIPTATLTAQVVNPADKQRPPEDRQGEPVVVEGRRTRVSDLREEDRVGSYQQPEWTTRRLFTETRLYVRPEGSCEFEFWVQPEIDSNGKTETKTQVEFEFGLPNRFQLDLYLVAHQDGNQGTMQFDEQKVEVRWALADWDKIWGNPTLYLEWAAKSEAPDGIEAKLLFGGEISEGWHWGSNLVFETETGGARENVYEITGGVSHTMIDEKWSLGAEVKGALADVAADRGNYTEELLLGPTMQYRLRPNCHFDFSALAGLTDDSPDAKFTLLFGWEF
ncbi:MAG: transporter [Planctomycetota bacterium]